jgi:hypothetical protein
MKCLKATCELRIINDDIFLIDFKNTNKLGDTYGPYNEDRGICTLCNHLNTCIKSSNPPISRFAEWYVYYYCYKFDLNLDIIL